MGFSMFSSNASSIALDFGSSSLKLLQIEGGERARLLRAAEIAIPDDLRLDPDRRFAFFADALPTTLDEANFKSRRVTIAIPSTQTFVQHMQFARVAGASAEELVKGQLYSQMGCAPESVVVRCVEVADIHRGGQAQVEVICFAIARDTIMRYVELLKKCRLDVVGVHTETMAVVRAFDHINRRKGDVDVTTLYADLGWSGINVAIAHGRDVMFGRHIPIGGRHFDQHISETLHCDIAAARAHRLALGEQLTGNRQTPPDDEAAAQRTAILAAAETAHAADQGVRAAGEEDAATTTEVDRRSGLLPAATCYAVPDGNPPYKAANVDLTELLDTITDELSMCLRYHQGLFPGRTIDRAIFVGGETRQVWLCQHVVRALHLHAQLGDPLSRLARDRSLKKTPGVNLDEPQPGWAVAYGLCTAPTDL